MDPLIRLVLLDKRHAAGEDVLDQLRGLEADLQALARTVEGGRGDGEIDAARAALLREHFRAGPLPLPADAPKELRRVSGRLAELPISAKAAAEVRSLLDALAARARERDAAAARAHAEVHARQLHAQVLEQLGDLLATLDRRPA